MNKAVLLSLLVAICAHNMQALSLSYPTQRALKKADHCLSLATTTAFLSAIVFARYDNKNCKEICFNVLRAISSINVLNNLLILKHERTKKVYIQTALPAVCVLGFSLAKRKNLTDKKTTTHSVGACLALFAIAANCIKNIWDVRELLSHEPQLDEHERDELIPLSSYEIR